MKADVDKVFQALLVKCFREEDSPVVERVVGYIREMRFQMWKTPSRATQDVTSVPTASAQRVDPARGQETRIPNSRKPESRDAPALQLQQHAQSTAGQSCGCLELGDAKVKVFVKHQDPECDEYLNEYLDVGSLFAQMCEQMAVEQPVEPLEHVIESLMFVRQQFKQVAEELSEIPKHVFEKYQTSRPAQAHPNSSSNPNFKQPPPMSPRSPKYSSPPGSVTTDQHGANMQRRSSVSAECAGDHYKVVVHEGSVVTEDVRPNMPSPQQPAAYPKPGKERARILLAMKQAVLFNGLADSVLGILVDAAQAVEHAAGDVVFHQGEEGVCYFIINEGQVETIQDPSRMNPGCVPSLRQTRGPLESFGELSIMYNSPRCVTAIALTAVKLWSIDRQTFHDAVGAFTRSREELLQAIRNVPILQELTNQQRALVGDGTQRVVYEAGQVIIQQGSAGDWFYMTEEGEASADIATSLGHTTVRKYGPGDFFGELSLLMGGPRAASVRADTRLQCFRVHAKHFEDLIAPHVDFRHRVIEYKSALM
eukprot:CAMPEP_0198216260 /NCGR_PEP_ID=MMETSP1445-20131203/56257_1 /TAXON_ID=36898 /ORGANISM="Pyramimonas sp., Strain CCMP2087" /LENGTH=536 /DNA_ID=CAMNT_0043892409 /DNA_START=256 /DNA_END=1866 /DNA_ORIENTATION=-